MRGTKHHEVAAKLIRTGLEQASGANGDAMVNDNYTAISGRFNEIWPNFYSNNLKELRAEPKAWEAKLPKSSWPHRVNLTIDVNGEKFYFPI